MTNLVDYILDLFRDPVQGEKFVKDPETAMRDAGVQNVTAAQVQAVAATAAPSVALGHGDPIVGLQRAVADQHGIASETFAPTFQPTHVNAPETSADVLSHNDTRLLSPQTDVHDDHSVNLSFGDFTLGNKTTAVGDGAVAVGHDSNAPILSGDGAVLAGSGSNVNTGDIHTGAGSNVTVGSGNQVHNSSQNAGGDVISDNKGPVIKDVDMSGGHGGSASAHGGLIGGANATGGAGGNAGSINIDSHDSSTVFGDQTNVSTHGDVGGNVNASHNDSHDDNSIGSHNTDNSTHDSHNHIDNSTHDSHNTQVDTHVDASIPLL
jgi:hypothetical protein